MLVLRRITRRAIKRVLILTGLIWFYNCLPNSLFTDPYANIMTGENGELLMATIADDGQWRFPQGNHVPEKFRLALIEFEDRRFYSHHGVSMAAIGRAMVQNIRNKRIISGGSTLSMQVIRMSRQRTGKAMGDKLLEMAIAIRMELAYSKEEILEIYASHAPFGGNVVGLEAASWRYFGHAASDLSWAESATLAVLPNAPGLMHPGKNRDQLKAKRNRLLTRLYKNGRLTKLEYNSALLEPLPMKPKPLPQSTYHYLEYSRQLSSSSCFKTSIDGELQNNILSLSKRYGIYLKSAGIHNLGILVLDVETGEVKSYIGNLESTSDAAFVDVVQAPRSTGSILKPFLYAGAIQSGQICPQMLLPDYPTRIHGYTPKNYVDAYDGMIPADEALSKSLNIPAVRLLSDYGVTRFKNDLKNLGLTTLFRPAHEYGLSLVLGGGEATLWELTHAYRMLALDASERTKNRYYDPAVAYSVLEAMTAVNRPGINQHWAAFNGRKIAWKTGTSYGARDAWAIGITQKYIVGVWVGNASGEGVAGMTGTGTAGPILFDVFRNLEESNWFEPPVRNMSFVSMCKLSGHRASRHCNTIKKTWLPKTCLQTRMCPYHRSGIGQNSTEREFQFILPVAAAHYYKILHPEYVGDTSFHNEKKSIRRFAVIYPQSGVSIRIPKTFSGNQNTVVFEAVHQGVGAELFWFIDKHFISSTKDIHQINIAPQPGKHVLTVVDETGHQISRKFSIE